MDDEAHHTPWMGWQSRKIKGFLTTTSSKSICPGHYVFLLLCLVAQWCLTLFQPHEL